MTRLSVVGCLGSLGCDQGNDTKGNERAYQILVEICSDMNTVLGDLAVSATAVSAIAQIAQNGSEERRAEVLSILRSLSKQEPAASNNDEANAETDEAEDDDSGFNYIEEIAAGHIDQLMSKGQTQT